MHTNRCLVNVILITLVSVNAQNEFNQIDSPTIIDSLTFPLIIDDLNVENEQLKFPIKEQITPKNVYHTEPISVRRRNSNQSAYKSKYFDKPTIGNEFNHSVFDVGESLCPDVYCFAKRLSSSDELTFDCKSQSFEVTSEDTMIDCHYWHVPSPGADSNQQRQSKQHGKGYDLRIVLKPSTISADDLSPKSNSASRLRISHLKPGVLNWIIETVRLSLKMPLSPVHLTISFIYFKRLGRDDLGNLATKSRVTHLSLWNPFYWDEDSFIPITNKTSNSSNNAGNLAEGPPYFRLSLFCDYENQNPSFRRLWFPWKSWQLRLTHCPDLYICWQWYSKYPICDVKQSTDNPERLLKSFIPSYLISPKSLMNSPQSLKQETGMQILYDNQCLPNPNQTNLVSDLKMNYRDQCLQSDNDKPVRDIQTNQKSNFNKTIPIILNQDNLIKDGISTEYLTSGLILLAILNIILIICFIILVLWIRRRIKTNSKNKLTNFHDLYQDYSGIDIVGNNSLYATNHCPLLISTISGSYLSGSHPKLNQRHHSFPNSSLSYSQNFNTFLPMSTYKTTDNNKYNSNQSQQFLLGRSTSYSSSMWNGSLRNGLNNNSSSNGHHNERVLLTNRLNSKRHLNYSSNGLSIESSQQITSTPYINRKDHQLINLPLPYHPKEINYKYSSQTLNPSLISSSSLTTVNVTEINGQKERGHKSIYSSRNRLSNGQPSPTPPLREIKKSPVVNYRKSKRKIGSGRPPLAASIKKPHTLVFEDDNQNKWSEDFKTSLHKL
ncbi:hypothetical protein Smp_055440 [Schistosoma mansoni]|uniref:hypothetical protein n=1 Tax=Schistosoma mansoni TaxID=6183 RepID=UPI0001A640C6|nr:hypothetical protein Smp_055440 [Schistosoma mansoni]|eukprot:XP_018647551.1 hypothetical protein Smp_055440 [Schistosoma mansoni]